MNMIVALEHIEWLLLDQHKETTENYYPLRSM